ncbi:hypothetical protein J3R83DRAFT_3891 [Lanmaoa asiatica]|nr:hypothetical protein J3R83DRAFT_3891 [Lanmaoa asiatica]
MPSIPSVTVIGNEGETPPRLTSLLGLDGLSADAAAEDRTTASEVPLHSSVQPQVGPKDSFAGVALRYGVSIAALRRANQLWPSDPIHLRTELLIPRGDTLRTRHKPACSASTDITLRSTVEPTPSPSPDLVASFVSARNMIVSVLPARISLESLSSKASTSEDFELDDFQKARARKRTANETPFAEEGHELSILAAPYPQYKRPGVLSSQVPCSPTNKHLDVNHITPVGDLRSHSISSSPTVSLERPRRAQPFAIPPVRTSQLEPEPAMELPLRRPRF